MNQTELLVLQATSRNMQNIGLGEVNYEIALDQVRKIKSLNLTPEQIPAIKSSQGKSLLQLSVENHNPYLAAFYLYEMLKEADKYSDDITSAIFFAIEQPTMKKAIFYPYEFLLENGLVENSESNVFDKYENFCKKLEIEHREYTEQRINPVFNITCKKSDNTELLENCAKYIASLDLLADEVNYNRGGDGWSLLHLAVSCKNPYLVALYLDLGANAKYKPYGKGVSPEELCQKIWGKWEEKINCKNIMEVAFKYPKQFLIKSGIIIDDSTFPLYHDENYSAFKHPEKQEQATPEDDNPGLDYWDQVGGGEQAGLSSDESLDTQFPSLSVAGAADDDTDYDLI